jgi:hypothetical protein
LGLKPLSATTSLAMLRLPLHRDLAPPQVALDIASQAAGTPIKAAADKARATLEASRVRNTLREVSTAHPLKVEAIQLEVALALQVQGITA